ncbi:hypothetical protein HDU87_006742, partial [Geranomyces variabilis]
PGSWQRDPLLAGDNPEQLFRQYAYPASGVFKNVAVVARGLQSGEVTLEVTLSKNMLRRPKSDTSDGN